MAPLRDSRVDRAAKLRDLAGRVLDDRLALENVGVAQPNFAPGDRRKNFFAGTSMKSSRSMKISREKGTVRVPAPGILGIVHGRRPARRDPPGYSR